MIVVDTNVIAYFLIEGEKTILARQLYEHDPDWVAPLLWEHEFLNVLASYCKQGSLPQEQYVKTWNNAVELLRGRALVVDMLAALKLAIKYGLSAYDAQYIALARSLRATCVTEDRLLQKELPDQAMSMKDFLASFPQTGLDTAIARSVARRSRG